MEGLESYLERLRALRPIRGVRVTKADRRGEREVVIDAGGRSPRLALVERRGRLSPLAAAALGPAAPSRLVVAPLIAAQAAGRLAADGSNYIDLAGNCHLE